MNPSTAFPRLSGRCRLQWAVAAALSAGALGAAAQSPAPTQALVVHQNQNTVLSGTGLCWRSSFGPASGADCPATPAPAAQAPAAPPIVAAAPQVTRITLDADALFDFDKATLRPAGRAKLDALAQQLKGLTPEKVSATGHTDRLGPAAYNQRLSVQRANAVRDYLVSQGVPANLIETQGKGASEPVTKDCKAGAGLVACLQPDRRVEVDVTGSKLAGKP